jgi:hypothetical protein
MLITLGSQDLTLCARTVTALALEQPDDLKAALAWTLRNRITVLAQTARPRARDGGLPRGVAPHSSDKQPRLARRACRSHQWRHRLPPPRHHGALGGAARCDSADRCVYLLALIFTASDKYAI